MRLEIVPLIIGALIALVGLGLVLDGWVPDDTVVPLERRRRPRLERHRGGEVLLGLGTMAIGAALIGRDAWRYSIVTAIAGAVFLLLGAWKNRAYLRQWMVNRGASRRGLPPRKPAPRETRIR